MTTIKPQHITFTGIDAKTDFQRCLELSKRYPIEWGVLFGGRLGKNRYPDEETLNRFESYPVTRSMHLCKDDAKRFNDGFQVPRIHMFDRIQVNMVSDAYDLNELTYMSGHFGKPVILQHRTMEFPNPIGMIQYLFDKSGGKGITPTEWPKQKPEHRNHLVGYAGGINPDNVLDVIASLDAQNYWLDMESGVRDADDWLDLDKVEEVCRAVYGEYGHG